MYAARNSRGPTLRHKALLQTGALALRYQIPFSTNHGSSQAKIAYCNSVVNSQISINVLYKGAGATLIMSCFCATTIPFFFNLAITLSNWCWLKRRLNWAPRSAVFELVMISKGRDRIPSSRCSRYPVRSTDLRRIADIHVKLKISSDAISAAISKLDALDI